MFGVVTCRGYITGVGRYSGGGCRWDSRVGGVVMGAAGEGGVPVGDHG